MNPLMLKTLDQKADDVVMADTPRICRLFGRERCTFFRIGSPTSPSPRGFSIDGRGAETARVDILGRGDIVRVDDTGNRDSIGVWCICSFQLDVRANRMSEPR
jgi:hypothetical protein